MNTSLAAPGALAHCLQRNTACNATPRARPHRLQNRQGQLTFPTSKNGDHFSPVIWALFGSEQLFICIPPSGEGKQVFDSPNQNTEVTVLYGRSYQHFLNRFFDLSMPSMRKGQEGEKTGEMN